jgi:protein O-GlcNAc transferase
LFLDTLPYGAHATARDALWAGLPVLTCLGNAFASRVAGSLLTAFGLPELVTSSLEEYTARALEYANSPALLAQMRAKLADRRNRAVFDTDLYRRHLESAYRLMWERHQRGAAPHSFSVPAAT